MAVKPISKSQSALPLGSLSAVVLDTETTGLNVRRDRVIEIGAVRITGGTLKEAETFAKLVNPGTAIPTQSTAVHGIRDEDVRQASPFGKVIEMYQSFAGEAVVIGYSIGFDLAVLKAEFERSGVTWVPPRSLDVRHLAKLVAPELPSESLATVAGWLGIPVGTRHRALADALLTARVFLALVPKLRARGIATLAQAQRSCLRLASRLGEEVAAGWHDAVQTETLVPAGATEFARIDSFPYRHRVADVMARPPAIARNDEKLRDVLTRMLRDKISSVFLEPFSVGGDFAIITERDILRAIDGRGIDALEAAASDFASRPLVTIAGDEFVYRAISRMTTRDFRQLGVTGEAGELAGALSARDLLRQRAGDAVALGESIERAQNAPELGQIWSELTVVARSLAHEGVSPHDTAAVISRELRALTKRACELAEIEMEADGGKPPCAYAMMVLGSSGRGESLLAMDQDNAIVFEKGEPGGKTDQWFERLASRVSDILNDAGVAYCKGGVMASRAAWRKDVDGWREMVGSWITHARPEDVLNSDIFFDALSVHGSGDLADELHREAHEAAAQASGFLKTLAIRAGEFQSPLGLFGRLKLEGGRVDVKKGGLMPIFSVARVAALRAGVTARSTPERLKAATSVDPAIINNLIEAHRVFLKVVLEQQLRDIDRGIALSNSIAPDEFSAHERDEIKWALAQVPAVRDIAGLPTFG